MSFNPTFNNQKTKIYIDNEHIYEAINPSFEDENTASRKQGTEYTSSTVTKSITNGTAKFTMQVDADGIEALEEKVKVAAAIHTARVVIYVQNGTVGKYKTIGKLRSGTISKGERTIPNNDSEDAATIEFIIVGASYAGT